MRGSPPPKTCCAYPTKIKHITVSIRYIFHSKSVIFDALGYNDKTCILKHILRFSSLLWIFYDFFSQRDYFSADFSKTDDFRSSENNSKFREKVATSSFLLMTSIAKFRQVIQILL